MVASAVPGMKTSRITVTDQHGRLLSSGSQDPASAARRKEQELERSQEQALREKIDSVLLPILGFGNYTAQVDIQMDFSAVEQTRKRFRPKYAIDPQRVRARRLQQRQHGSWHSGCT